jgi:multiple sugar transport system permease protein
LAFLAFASPWLLNLVVLGIGPMIASLVFSFFKYDIIHPPVFVGLKNYSDALVGSSSKLFLKSLVVTLNYAITAVPLQLIGGFLVALLMNQKVRGIYAFRLIYYLPAVTSGVASALLWRFALHSQYGVFNYWLYRLGLDPIPWLTTTDWAFRSLVVTSLWSLGSPMIIYLSGFASIPDHLYEAAELDGAGRLRRFWHVTLPMMSPVIFFNLIMGIVNSFNVFTTAFALTRGGPGRATYVFMLYLTDVAFQDFRMGYGCAIAWLIFWLIYIMTRIAFRTAGSRVYYEGGEA